jgi:hypothetical protein
VLSALRTTPHNKKNMQKVYILTDDDNTLIRGFTTIEQANTYLTTLGAFMSAQNTYMRRHEYSPGCIVKQYYYLTELEVEV